MVFCDTTTSDIGDGNSDMMECNLISYIACSVTLSYSEPYDEMTDGKHEFCNLARESGVLGRKTDLSRWSRRFSKD